ncbi:hypothetical protein [Leadbettera azotonutricia]|nr:hypothetical protein [Leadbettera azotonutricia]
MPKKRTNINPADEFITRMASFNNGEDSPRDEETLPMPKSTPPKTHPTRGKDGMEHKTKRLNLLIQPSLHEDIKKISVVKATNLNEIVNQALREYRDKEKRSLEKYEEIQRVRNT